MARGNGRGRGFRGGRGDRGTGGRGRGGRGGYRGGRGNGRDMPRSSFIEDELDFSIQMFADARPTGESNTYRGRGRDGRGGGQFSGPNSGAATSNRGRGRGGYDSPRGRGYESPRGRGRGQDSFTSARRGDYGIGASPRGRGRGGAQTRPGTLSGLLYQKRPLLRPIVFVPSVLTKVLFQEEEELIKPGVEDVDDTEQSHLPTADQVSRVFSSGNIPRMESDLEDEEDGEEIEEVDFNEVDKLFDSSSTTKTTTTVRRSKLGEITTITEQQFTGFYVDPIPTSNAQQPVTDPTASIPDDVDDLAKMMDETLSAADEPDNSEDVAMSVPPTEQSAIFALQEPSAAPQSSEAVVGDKPEEQLFCVDLEPAPVPTEMAPTQDLLPSALRDDDEDDIIVYVAPHPRKASSHDGKEAPVKSEENAPSNGPDISRFSPYVSAAALPIASGSSSQHPLSSVPPVADLPSFSSLSFSFSQSTTTKTPVTPGKSTARLRVPPVSTPRQAKAWKRKRGLAGKKGLKSSFGAFGAMREEAQLHRQDPRRSERRRGDSDLEWGDTDDDDVQQVDEVEEGVQELLGWSDKGKGRETAVQDTGEGEAKDGQDVDDAHGMEVDALDLAAMRNFVGGLLGTEAGKHVTMDDVRDAEIMRMEDKEEDENEEDEEDATSEDDSEEDVLAAEEAMLISDTLEFEDDKLEDDSEDDEDDDEEEEDDQTPRTSFEARLQRLREKSRSKKPADTSMEDMDDDSDEDRADFLPRNMTWAEEDEDFIQEIQDMLDENEDVLTGRDRKQKNALFRSIRSGTFEYLEGFSPAKRRKEKGKDLPPDLQAQWEKDRKAKAEYKKARELARLEAAADPLSKKKGGKKGRKAMLAAAKLDPTITVIPNRIIDMTTLVQQIRRFIADVGGPSTMSLPPTNKETRKNVHEMALAFNLKSVSMGKGDARYTTLTKTTRSGVGVKEQKIARIVRRSGGMGARGDSFIYDKKGKGPPAAMPRHRDGDVVGKAAPKLTEANVGFRMLALMGWSEGTRIGYTGGLDAPLTAIIKNTKLGLGATK